MLRDEANLKDGFLRRVMGGNISRLNLVVGAVHG
jgi:hypothetical protein